MRRALPRLNELGALFTLFELRTVSRWVGLGLLVGVLSGLAAAVFYVAMDWVAFWFSTALRGCTCSSREASRRCSVKEPAR